MHFSLDQLKDIVISAADKELLPRFTRVEHVLKDDGSVLTEADLAIQNTIAAELKQHWPEVAFLGEEMAAEEQAALLDSGQPVWCLDPLDGTRNFAAGIPYFSISLALLQGGDVSHGVVYDPVRRECFTAMRGEGAALNGQRLLKTSAVPSLKESTALVDFKRLAAPLATRLVTEIPYSSQRSFGSVALDWCWLAAGRCHVYLHGSQNIWDYAAGNLVFHEVGGTSSTLSGEAVFVNQLRPRSAVAALDKQLFDEWFEWLND